jgi:hypothetical protein
MGGCKQLATVRVTAQVLERFTTTYFMFMQNDSETVANSTANRTTASMDETQRKI